jgi:very-short-patch-repair endonuclease
MPHRCVEQGLHELAVEMRKNPTDAENLFWQTIRNRNIGLKFRRQVVINNKFIVDFINFEHKIIVEIDGGQHAKNKSDEERSEYLNKLGFRVLHFWNTDILTNINGCIDVLLSTFTPPPTPPARGGG